MLLQPATYRVTWEANVSASFASRIDCNRLAINTQNQIRARSGEAAVATDAISEILDRTLIFGLGHRPYIHTSIVIAVTASTDTRTLDMAYYTAMHDSGAGGISAQRLADYTLDDGGMHAIGSVFTHIIADINSVSRTVISVPSGAVALASEPQDFTGRFLANTVVSSSHPDRVGHQTPSAARPITDAISNAATHVADTVSQATSSPVTMIALTAVAVTGAALLGAYVIRSVK
jgi:hypothetical protein